MIKLIFATLVQENLKITRRYSVKIIKADLSHTDDIARLFDLYRQFYQCEADLPLATEFIRQRLENNESVIFLAQNDQGGALGFTQLYPSFCSVEAVKIFILYDLYVEHNGRQSGIGRKLMQQATDYARKNSAARLDLLTAKDNIPGQKLYEQQGYVKTNEDFYAYSLAIKQN